MSIGISLAVIDAELQKTLEPGTPSPKARLALIRDVADAGFAPHVMVAPVLPYLSDSVADLDALLRALAYAGASGVTAFPLHLRGATKPWFLDWLAVEHPGSSRVTAVCTGGVGTSPGVFGVVAGADGAAGPQVRAR